MLQADETYDGRTVKLATGEFFEIVLAENPTTGYRWHFVEAGSPGCTLIHDAYQTKSEGVPGQGGVHRWRIQGAQAGTCKLEMAYRRSWEQSAPSVRTFRLQVEVRKGAQERTPAKPTE